MTCSQCRGIEEFFDEGAARRDLRRYRRKGPARTTRILLEELETVGVDGRTLLDVGGGVGALQHALLERGVEAAVHLDASPAYLEASRSEAERRGHADRVRYLRGDAAREAPEAGPADLVTLDRVVCCYDDMEALVDATASRARAAYGLVYPRVNLLTRLGFRVINLVQRLRGHPFHVFLHDPAAVERRVAAHGLRKRAQRHTFLWQIQLYTP